MNTDSKQQQYHLITRIQPTYEKHGKIIIHSNFHDQERTLILLSLTIITIL